MGRRLKENSITLTLVFAGFTFLFLAMVGCSSDSEPQSSFSPDENPAGGPVFLASPPQPIAAPLGFDLEKTKEIDDKGGDVKINGMFIVDFPKNALAEEVEITVSVLDQELLIFNVEPEDLALALPVEVWFEHLNDTDFKKAESVTIFKMIGDAWEPLPTTANGEKASTSSIELGTFAIGVAYDEAYDPGAEQEISFVRYLDGPGYQTKLIEADKGGQVQYGRYKVEIPKYALAEDTHITVRDPGSAYLICELEPHGIVFNIPVELEMDIKNLDTAPFFDWTIYWYNDATGLWVDQSAVLDKDKITAQLSHFSRYGGGRAGW